MIFSFWKQKVLCKKIGTRVEFRNKEKSLLADIEVLFERLKFLHKSSEVWSVSNITVLKGIDQITKLGQMSALFVGNLN